MLKELEELNKENVKFITYEDYSYPKRLKDIYDFPYWLYVKGDLQVLDSSMVAVIGSRNCSNYGEIVAKKIAMKLAQNEICVVSGMARGIDTCAHIGALAENGKTVAVLGSRI